MSELNYPNIAPDLAIENLKVPPFSREAEQSILGGLLLNNDSWIVIADLLTKPDFYLPEHQILFMAIKSLYEKGDPCDPVTLADLLKRHKQLDTIGGAPYLAMLASNIPSAANIVAYAKIVRERAILRQLMGVGQEIADSAFNTQGRTSSQLLDNAEKRVFEIAELGAKQTNGFIKIEDILTATIDRIDLLSRQTGSITGMETGFKQFDQQTSGLQRSDLIIAAGRPSMGKTAFAMNIAGHVAIEKHMPVAVFSMEMSNEQLAMRLISSIAEVNLQKVRNGQLDDDDWPKITNAVTKLATAPLFIDETPALSPTELRAKVRRLAREQGQLSLIVIDYLQLMQVPGNGESRANEVSEISRSLKSLAKELNVPVLALSQLNRSLEQRTDKRPKMSDLRESGSIEQDADLIIFIYRDEVYNEESPDKGIAEIIISKQRNGPIGMNRLNFNGNITRFENLADGEYQN